MMLPTCTSGKVNVFARYFIPRPSNLPLTSSLSKTLPSKFAIEPSGLMVREKLRRDPAARNYMDVALTPVADEEFDSFEMFTASDATKSEVMKMRGQPPVSAARSEEHTS